MNRYIKYFSQYIKCNHLQKFHVTCQASVQIKYITFSLVIFCCSKLPHFNKFTVIDCQNMSITSIILCDIIMMVKVLSSKKNFYEHPPATFGYLNRFSLIVQKLPQDIYHWTDRVCYFKKHLIDAYTVSMSRPSTHKQPTVRTSYEENKSRLSISQVVYTRPTKFGCKIIQVIFCTTSHMDVDEMINLIALFCCLMSYIFSMKYKNNNHQ